jgi:hypothetical protein
MKKWFDILGTVIIGSTLSVLLIAVAVKEVVFHIPIEHCRRNPPLIQSFPADDFDHATWETLEYVDRKGERCADITKRSTWLDGYSVFVWRGWYKDEWINQDRGYSLEEAEHVVESRYCKL